MGELSIRLIGRPASKKNSRVNLPDGRSFPSKAYRNFRKSALEELKNYNLLPGFPLKEVVLVNYTFYQKGKYEQDNDNAEGSINDVLQEAGIIVDDKIIKNWAGKIIPNSPDWLTEVQIFW